MQCTAADGSEIRSATDRLTLPHPHAHERAFVLVPWLAADPDAVLSGTPVASWIDQLPDADVAGVRLPGGGRV